MCIGRLQTNSVCGHTVLTVSLNLPGNLKSFKWQRELIFQSYIHQRNVLHRQCMIILDLKNMIGVLWSIMGPICRACRQKAAAKGSNTSHLSQHRRDNHSFLHAQVKVKTVSAKCIKLVLNCLTPLEQLKSPQFTGSVLTHRHLFKAGAGRAGGGGGRGGGGGGGSLSLSLFLLFD